MPPLYRQFDRHSYIRYDPATDEVAILPADELPEGLAPVPGMKPVAGASFDPTDGERRAEIILIAMLDHQHEARESGRPAQSAPALAVLLQSLPDAESLIRLDEDWTHQLARASGTPRDRREHAAVLFGNASHPRLEHPAGDSGDTGNAARAQAILESILIGGPVAVHLAQLARDLPAMSLEQLRAARAQLPPCRLAVTWGKDHSHALRLADALQQHACGFAVTPH